jgi:hypothetical protein
VQNLENELGVPLFVRSNLGAQLTDYGEILLKEQPIYYPNNKLSEVGERKVNDESCDRRQPDWRHALGRLWGFQETTGVRISLIEHR